MNIFRLIIALVFLRRRLDCRRAQYRSPITLKLSASPTSTTPRACAIILSLLAGVIIGGLHRAGDAGVAPVHQAAQGQQAGGRASAAPGPGSSHPTGASECNSSTNGSGSSCSCPLAALQGWVIGRRGGQRHSDSQVSQLSTHLFPRPELPAQRAAGQGDRAVPAHRGAGQGNLRDPGRAGPPVPPARRSRPRDPPAPGAGAAQRPQRPAEGAGAAGAGRGLHALGPAGPRRNRVHRPRAASTSARRRRSST